MDCPYIIIIEPDVEKPGLGRPCGALAWLKENNITRFRYDWKHYGLRFRFESEHDKLLFALRWA